MGRRGGVGIQRREPRQGVGSGVLVQQGQAVRTILGVDKKNGSAVRGTGTNGRGARRKTAVLASLRRRVEDARRALEEIKVGPVPKRLLEVHPRRID